jgi:hypothetical protein
LAHQIARVGTGAASADAINALTVLGAHAIGSTETCSPKLTAWLTAPPVLTAYRWYRDGAELTGQSGQTYLATASDAGHQIACGATGRYATPQTIFTLQSAAVTIPLPVAAKKQLLTCTIKKSRVSCKRKLVEAAYILKKSGKYKVKSAKLVVGRKSVKVKVLVTKKSIKVLAPDALKKGTYKLKVGRKTQRLKVA